MAVLFSHVRVSTPDENEAEFLVCGIPRELDDFDYYTTFVDFLDSIEEDTEITVHADAYLYGEGETFKASIEEVAYFHLRMQKDENFLSGHCDHIESVTLSAIILPMKTLKSTGGEQERNAKKPFFARLFRFFRAIFSTFCFLQLFPSRRDLNPRRFRIFELLPLSWYNVSRKRKSEGAKMKREHRTVRRLKLSNFELRVLIDALNARRLKEKARGADTTETADLILYLLDVLEA